MTEPSDTTTDRPAHLWQPGQSGNPAGRPKGLRNRASQLAEISVDDRKAIVVKIVQRAKEGDPAAMRIVANMILPRRRPVRVTLPDSEDLTPGQLAGQILGAMADGEVTPSEAREMLVAVREAQSIIDGRAVEERLGEIKRLEAIKRLEDRRQVS